MEGKLPGESGRQFTWRMYSIRDLSVIWQLEVSMLSMNLRPLKLSFLATIIICNYSSMAQQKSEAIFSSGAYTIKKDRVIQGGYTARALSPTAITSDYKSSEAGKQTASSWKLSRDVSAFPQYKSDYLISDALYNMALEEMQNAVEPDSTFRTGKEWGGVWTRDISYSIILSMATLQPKVAEYSLLRKVKNNRIIQDTGTGGSYPVSSDRMIWAVAAWEVYKVTGDQEWLKKAYGIICNSTEDDHKNIYAPETGLLRGESSFLDWREQSYPRWMQPADIYDSECLGTNAVHYQVNIVLAKMARLLDDDKAALEYSCIAQKIKSGINKYLWMPEKGYYGQYLYGRNYKILSPRAEALGEALSVIFGIAGPKKQQSIVAAVPVNDYGTPCIYPQIPDIPPYHNNAVWPFVQSFWSMAAAKAGNEQALIASIAAVYRPNALFLTNKENFVATSGDFGGTQINSSNMLWSLSGSINLVYKVLFGMDFGNDGIVFKPFVPESLKGKRSLHNFKYRKAILDITMEGYGNEIASVKLDGKRMPGAKLSADLSGNHQIEIILNNSRPSPGKVNLVKTLTSPPAPVLSYSSGKLSWQKVARATKYMVLKNGTMTAETLSTEYAIPEVDKLDEYQVIAQDPSGIQSFASEPLPVYQKSSVQLIQAESIAPVADLPYQGFSGTGFAEISKSKNTRLSFEVSVPKDGIYAIDFRYANGNGPVNTENKCALRTLWSGRYFLGTVVFPQRGTNEWSNWGFSNPLQVKLKKGTQKLSLTFEQWNENMNGEVNQAMLDYVRVVSM
jgi:hypothetical protein